MCLCLCRRRRSSSATFGVTVKADHIREAPLAATTISVLLEVTGAPSSTIEGAGLDLVVVLDVSDSMRGTKLDQLKLGMQFVIKKLRPGRDRLCIITFTFRAARLTPLRVMSEAAKSEFELIVNGLAVGGRGTSILAGLLEGVDVLQDRRQADGRSANILLMSDGQQTCGPNVNASIVDPPSDAAIYTLAFGADADARLLQELAVRHGGMFNAVPVPESGGLSMAVVAILSQLIAGLQTVVVQNLKLILTKPSSSHVDVDLDRIVRVAPGGYGYTTEMGSYGTITVMLWNLFSGEVRKVVVDLLLIASPDTDRDYETDILDVKVVYDNVQLGTTEMFRIPTLHIARTTSSATTGGMITTWKLQAELARRQHADYIETARLLADGGNLQGARCKLAEAQNALEGFPKQADDPMVVAILSTELRQLLDRMESQELYNKEGRPYALAAETSHVCQRFASRADVDGVRLFATPRMDTDLQQAKRFAEKPDTPLPVADGTPLPITDEENLKKPKSHKWLMAGLGG